MDDTIRFTVFCLENYKQYRQLTGREVYDLFQDYGVFDYIREFYDILHTMGEDYINHDIDIYLKNRNAPIPA